jgi:K+-transporting ATPase c subunit
MLKAKTTKQTELQESTDSALDVQMYNQSLRVDTLKMAMAVLDARIKREIDNQQLLPVGRQAHIEPYSIEELIVEAQKILSFVTSE